jgi:HAE1 family hydrophobic/amphiphilic exporter-1
VNLADVSIRRPVFAVMLVLGLVVLGLVSLGRLEMQLDPDIEFPTAWVTTVLRGASPETVESEVTDVLEEQINAIEGIRTLSSISSEGLSRIGVEFRLDYDIDTKVQEVRDKVALARPLLPLDVEDPVVGKFDLNAISMMNIVLGGALSLREISDLAEHDVKERLERLPGVGAVEIVGAREREIRIWLDPLRLTGYGLSIDDVANTLRLENAELASGRIEGDRREWSVTTQGKAKTVADFGELIVAERAGRLVRLREVAVVEDGMAEARSIARLNGRPGVSLEIQRQSGADMVGIARHVRAEIERIRESLPPGVEISVARDYAIYIEAQVRSVFEDMLIATGLVVVVVLFFLRNARSTFIAMLAIPSSVIGSFTLFYALDLSLNVMTLMALSLAIGLVIDDTIVVLESIYRRIEAGEDAMSAAQRGTREVGLAVVSTTLAVCAVFVSIAFMRSVIGRYFYEFGVAVTAAVFVSVIVAFTLTPMLASRMLRQSGEPGWLFRRFARALVALDGGYRWLLVRSLRHKFVTLAVGAAAVLGGCGVASTLPFNLYAQEDLNEVLVQAKFPIGTPLSVTDRLLRRMEGEVMGHPDVRDVIAGAGNESRHEPHRARIEVMLIPKQQRERPVAETFQELRTGLLAAIPEAEEITVGLPTYGDTEGTHTDMNYSLQGPDLGRLERYANQLTARMREDPVFVDVSTSFEAGKPQITLDVDRGRAADLGVSAVAIGRTIRTLLAGEKVGSFEEAGRRHDVRVQVLPEYRDDPAKIDLIRVRSLRGELVPITSAASVRLEEGPVEIRRENRTRKIAINANMASGIPLSVGTTKFEAWGAELGIQPPDEIAAGGRVRVMGELITDVGFAFGLGLLALYMILASLFNSFTHPFTIMMSAPLSFIGGFLALKLLGMSLDMMSSVGLLVLMGLVMKNGILLVDYTNQLREAGRSCEEALLEAGPVRMRPVLMTSGALIFGMLPMVLTEAIGAEFRAPMAAITIGGLFTSTLLTLIVVPVVYSVVDAGTLRLQTSFGRLRALVTRRAPLEPSA